jgi:curved DNA-binding protein CbpA
MRSGRGVTETPSRRARRRAGARDEGAVGREGAVSHQAAVSDEGAVSNQAAVRYQGAVGYQGAVSDQAAVSDQSAVGDERAVSDDPFARLGLPARPGLCDDDVRAAWRRIAAATHPDREDGGDPAGFGAAAAAYVVLRTEFGRGEALADLGLSGTMGHRGRPAHGRRRSADPSVQPAGRHRAGRGAGVSRRTGARLPELTRLRGWIARRTAPHGRANAANQDPADTAARVPGDGAAPSPVDAGRRPLTRVVPGSQWSRLSLPQKRRPGRLALRLAGAVAGGVAAVVISGWSPGVAGVLAGVLTWLLATARHALARRRSQ